MVQKHSGYDVTGEEKIGGVSGLAGQVKKSQGPGLPPVWGFDDYGLSFLGVVTGIAGAPNFQCSGLIGFGDDYFEGYWAYVVWDAGGAGAAPQGEQLECTGYTSATGDFTVAAFSAPLAVGDKVLLLHPNQVEAAVDTQIRTIQSGVKAINAGIIKYLHIDSGTNGAEILSIAIEGVIGHDWTLDVYVPAADAEAATSPQSKRNTITYAVADTEGGLLGPFGVPFDCYLDFTNNGANDQITQVTITYRSRGVLTLAWEV